MKPPMISFITWNRAGLSARNLNALLQTTDDFELYLVDNNSQDDTWDYLQTVHDSRIQSKTRLDLNRGQVYALNYLLAKRAKDQFFITFDSDVYIQSKDWITQFMRVMNTFPDVGILGLLTEEWYKVLTTTPVSKGQVSYRQSAEVVGWCNCIRPEVFEILGYYNEETYGADVDNSARLRILNSYKVGYVPTIQFAMPPAISCDQCLIKPNCSFLPRSTTCFDFYNSKYKHREFVNIYRRKEEAYLQEIIQGKRDGYCASVHDESSLRTHPYNKEWAEENFNFFIQHCN